MLTALAVCTGNAERSILAEAVLRQRGGLRAVSGGTNPAGRVPREILALLARRGIPLRGLRSKHVREFCLPGALAVDLVIALCPAALAEMPRLPGDPETVLWPLADPAALPAEERGLARAAILSEIERRAAALAPLPSRTRIGRPRLAGLEAQGWPQ